MSTRRRFVFVGAMGVVAALLLSACDWTQFRYGPARTGFNPTETKISPANVGTLVEAWSAATGGVVSSSPAVAVGVAYVGSYDGKLYAFDAAGATGCSATPKTCSPLWTATTGGAIYSSPAVANGVVYVGSGDGKLYAFDAAGATGCSGAPTTCSPLWTANTTGGAIDSSPAVANGVVYVSSDDGTLYALDAAGVTGCSRSPERKTCAPLWTAATASLPSSSPAVANGIVYASSIYGELYAFDAAGVKGCSGSPKTCSPLWTYVGLYSTFLVPAVANGVVYVGSFDRNDWGLYAFDAAGVKGCSGIPKTCSPLWTAAPNANVFSSPAVANGVVYVAGLDGVLYAFDAAGCGQPLGQNCAPLWTSVFLSGEVLGSPAVANGVVFVATWAGFLSAFDAAGCGQLPLERCNPVWTEFVGESSESSPAVANGVVYVGSYDKNLHAYQLP